MKYAYLISMAMDKGKVVLVENETQELNLEQLQTACNCDCIEIVHGTVMKKHVLMCCDDEGKLKKEHVNLRASIIYGTFYDCMVGDVVIGKQIMTVEGPDIGCFDLDEAKSMVYYINDNLEDLERWMGIGGAR